jgi:hypothetical protein
MHYLSTIHPTTSTNTTRRGNRVSMQPYSKHRTKRQHANQAEALHNNTSFPLLAIRSNTSATLPSPQPSRHHTRIPRHSLCSRRTGSASRTSRRQWTALSWERCVSAGRMALRRMVLRSMRGFLVRWRWRRIGSRAMCSDVVATRWDHWSICALTLRCAAVVWTVLRL